MFSATLRNRLLAGGGIIGFVGVIVIADLGCPGSGGQLTENTSTVVDQLVLSPPENSVRVGGSVQFRVTVYDKDHREMTGQTVTWEEKNRTFEVRIPLVE